MPVAPEIVRRHDFSSLRGKPSRTPQGFLRVPGVFTRTGVFEYVQTDGTVFREYRPASEVFADASMQTLLCVPVTDMHPVEAGQQTLVDPSNVRKFSEGVVASCARVDDRLLGGELIIMTASLIDKVNRGEACEVSCSYKALLALEPGSHHGERYDGVQTSIRYNHVAVGPEGWARAGREAQLHLDGVGVLSARYDSADTALGSYLRSQMEAQSVDAHALASKAGVSVADVYSVIEGWAPVPSFDILKALAASLGLRFDSLLSLIPQRQASRVSGRSVSTMEEEILLIGGVEYKVSKAVAQAYKQERLRLDGQLTELTKRAEQAQARLDSIDSELQAEKAARAKAEDPKRFDDAVFARVALIEQVKKAGLSDKDIAGKSRRQLQEAVILRLDSRASLTGKSDDYVDARFDSMLEGLQARTGTPGFVHTAGMAFGTAGVSERADAEKSRLAMQEASRKAWEKPLAFSSLT